MGIQYTPLTITSVLVMAFTVWMIVGRFKAVAESNWPLFYYLGIVIYSFIYPGYLDPRVVYAGVLIALFLRFEFNGRFLPENGKSS